MKQKAVSQLAQELVLQAGLNDIGDALCKLGLIKPHEKNSFTVDAQNWERGGAETYILPFGVNVATEERRFIFKACVAPCIGCQIDSVVGKWLERRSNVEKNGLNAPQLYAYKNGVILEEFIPARLADALHDSPKEKIAKDMAHLYGVLGELGFQPIRIAADLRVKNEKIYMIDFGEDLGEATGQRTDLWPLFKREMETDLGFDLEPSSWDILQNIYVGVGKLNNLTTTKQEKYNMRERTLVLLKPDAIKRKLVGEIIKTFEEANLDIVSMKVQIADRPMLEQHYAKDDAWFSGVGQKTLEGYEAQSLDPVAELGTNNPVEIGKKVQSWLIDFMSSGPLVAMVLEGNDAVANVRRIVGHTLPNKADPGSIRGRFSSDSPDVASSEQRPVLNLVHASGELSEAKAEIKLWFPEVNPEAPKPAMRQAFQGNTRGGPTFTF